jgi:hypothetical protein
MKNRPTAFIGLAVVLGLAIAGGAVSSCKMLRGTVSGPPAAGKDIGPKYVCEPDSSPTNPKFCLARSGEPAPCLTAVVIAPTDSGTPAIYVMRGTMEDATFAERRPYLFEHAEATIADTEIKASWGPRLSPRLLAQLSVKGLEAKGFSGTITGVFETQYGEEVFEIPTTCHRNDDYKRHLSQSAEWEDELTQHPF